MSKWDWMRARPRGSELRPGLRRSRETDDRGCECLWVALLEQQATVGRGDFVNSGAMSSGVGSSGISATSSPSVA